MAKAKGGLDRWFKEKWVDVKTGKPCGRQKGEKRKGYPACRPSKRVSKDTPKTAGEMTPAEREKFKKRSKQSSKKISYQHKRSKAKSKAQARKSQMTKEEEHNWQLIKQKLEEEGKEDSMFYKRAVAILSGKPDPLNL